MHLEPWRIITSLWILTGIVWALGALTARQTRRHEPPLPRVLHLALVVLAFWLVFEQSFGFAPLHALLFPATPTVQWTAAGLALAGIGIAVYARIRLGTNWSATVTVKRDHRLIRTGPYAVVWHPIYSGLLLALLGTALCHARVAGLLGVAAALLAWRLKWHIEETFMEREFGAEYAEYKRRVKALIPLVW
jgi:protein-S-isoprenylcysteine O-methyltransferase